MSSKAARRRAHELVAAYHEECLAELIRRVADELDRFRAGQVDVFAVDAAIHQYHQAAKKLWIFCWVAGSGSHIESVASTIEQLAGAGTPIDWWEHGEPAKRH